MRILLYRRRSPSSRRCSNQYQKANTVGYLQLLPLAVMHDGIMMIALSKLRYRRRVAVLLALPHWNANRRVL